MTAYSDSVSLMETEVSAADIAGKKFIGKSRIFSLGATIEAELHKLTAKKMTIVKITPLLWIQVSLSDRKKTDVQTRNTFLSREEEKMSHACPSG